MNDRQETMDRRDYLTALGAAGTAVLAGCSGNDSNSQTGNGEENTGNSEENSGENVTVPNGNGQRNAEGNGVPENEEENGVENGAPGNASQNGGKDEGGKNVTPFISFGENVLKNDNGDYVIPGEGNYVVGVGNVKDADLGIGENGTLKYQLGMVSDPEKGNEDVLGEVGFTYDELLERLEPGNYQLIVKHNDEDLSKPVTIEEPPLNLDNVDLDIGMTPENPEIGDQVVLSPNLRNATAESYNWNINSDVQDGGNNVTLTPQTIQDFNIGLEAILENTDQTLNESLEFRPELEDNTDVRQMHYNLHPAADEIDPNYSISIIDEDMMRWAINQFSNTEEILGQRQYDFTTKLPISDLTDYSNVESRSASIQVGAHYYIMKDVEDFLSNVRSDMSEKGGYELSQENQVFEGTLRPPNSHGFYGDEEESEVIVMPENDLVIRGMQNFPLEHNNDQAESWGELRALAADGQIDNITQDIGHFLESPMHNQGGVIIERIADDSLGERSPLAGGNQLSSVPISSPPEEGSFGYPVSSMTYNPEEDVIDVFYKEPFGYVEDLKRVDTRDQIEFTTFEKTYDDAEKLKWIDPLTL